MFLRKVSEIAIIWLQSLCHNYNLDADHSLVLWVDLCVDSFITLIFFKHCRKTITARDRGGVKFAGFIVSPMHVCSVKLSTGYFQIGDCRNPTRLSTTQSSSILFHSPCPGRKLLQIVGVARNGRGSKQASLKVGGASCCKMSYKFIPPPENASSLLPSEARAIFRTNGYYGHTSGFCAGYTQANLLVVPGHLADDFEEFCGVNSAPFPLLYRSRAGDCSAPPLAKDSDVK